MMYDLLTGGSLGQLLRATGGGSPVAWASLLGLRIKKIAFDKQTSESDTGWDLPDDSIVLDVIIEVVTNAAGASIDVGLLSSESGGDPDGFLDGASLANAISLGGAYSVTKTTGSNENYISAVTRTIGELLCDHEEELGSDNATDHGFANATRKHHVAASVTAKSVTFTTSNHTVTGYIYIIYIDSSEND
jgi:hypothetical protein